MPKIRMSNASLEGHAMDTAHIKYEVLDMIQYVAYFEISKHYRLQCYGFYFNTAIFNQHSLLPTWLS